MPSLAYLLDIGSLQLLMAFRTNLCLFSVTELVVLRLCLMPRGPDA